MSRLTPPPLAPIKIFEIPKNNIQMDRMFDAYTITHMLVWQRRIIPPHIHALKPLTGRRSAVARQIPATEKWPWPARERNTRFVISVDFPFGTPPVLEFLLRRRGEFISRTNLWISLVSILWTQSRPWPNRSSPLSADSVSIPQTNSVSPVSVLWIILLLVTNVSCVCVYACAVLCVVLFLFCFCGFLEFGWLIRF